MHLLHVVLKAPVLKDLVAGGTLKAGRLHVFLAHVAFQVTLLGRALSAKEANESQVADACLGRHQIFQLLKVEIYKMEQRN